MPGAVPIPPCRRVGRCRTRSCYRPPHISQSGSQQPRMCSTTSVSVISGRSRLSRHPQKHQPLCPGQPHPGHTISTVIAVTPRPRVADAVAAAGRAPEFVAALTPLLVSVAVGEVEFRVLRVDDRVIRFHSPPHHGSGSTHSRTPADRNTRARRTCCNAPGH
jgi:hypothetical protein